MVMDHSSPRNQWPLGRVTEAILSRDNQVRVVKVRMVNMKDIRERSRLAMINEKAKFLELVRPVSKLILVKSISEL